MSNKNLSTVTTDLIETYGNTAKNMIQAYRVGNLRVAHYVDQRWENALKQSASQMRAEVAKNALAAQKTISGMYVKGIDLTSNSADVVVNKVVAFAGKGVQQVASNASAFEKRTGVATLNSLAKATVPAVIVVSGLAGKLEQGSSKLANTVAGKKSGVTAATVKRAATKKAASVTKKAASSVEKKADSVAKKASSVSKKATAAPKKTTPTAKKSTSVAKKTTVRAAAPAAPVEAPAAATAE
jgi:hypothetical protein